MRRAALALMLLSGISCQKAPTPAERGAVLFRPAADKLGMAMAVDLKAKANAAYEKYLKETGSKDEVELGRRLGAQYLVRYAVALAVSEAQEADLKAGKVGDVERRKKFNDVANRYVAGGTSMVGSLILAKSQAGPEWTSGLQLELAVRILEAEVKSR
jgi:hypothetical protein